jgi:hypothetical protein
MVSNASDDFPDPGEPGEDDQLVAGQLDREVLEVVLAGAPDEYRVGPDSQEGWPGLQP